MKAANEAEVEVKCGSDTDKITEGKYVLVQRGEQERIIEYKPHESLKYGRGSNFQEVSLRNVCGHLFYSTFRVKLDAEKHKGKDPKLVGQFCNLEPVIVSEVAPAAVDRNSNSGRDNRHIFDDNKSQPLGAVDIATMRELGVSGPEILDKLVSKSKSFGQKTEFSQEKYLKRKEKQYGDTLIFLKPTIGILADYYFRKDPLRVMNLRADALSQMLSFANVHANGKFLVYETGCSGLLVAAVLQRLGGLGIALHVHTGSTPQRQALFYMNFTKKELKPLRSLDVFYMIRPDTAYKNQTVCSSDAKETENLKLDEPVPKKPKLEDDSNFGERTLTDITKSSDEYTTVDSESTLREGENGQRSEVAKLGNINRVENEKSAELLSSTEFDGLLIVSKEHPLSILQNLLPRLGSSVPFAVFCQYPEPLMECYSWVKEKNAGVNLSVIENWMRILQVEVDRTHPEINMNSNGGFILFGITVKSS